MHFVQHIEAQDLQDREYWTVRFPSSGGADAVGRVHCGN